MKDEKKHYGTVDEPYRETSFVNQMRLLLLCEKFEAMLKAIVKHVYVKFRQINYIDII